MYYKKEVDILVFVVVVLSIFALAGFKISYGLDSGITLGDEVGLPKENQSFLDQIFNPQEKEVKIQANCGGVTACNCGDTMVNSYNITSDLQCNGDGLTISTENIILNCNKHLINQTSSGYANNGITINANNITIVNCTLIHFNNGINVATSNLSNLTNSTLFNNSIGIKLFAAKNTTITSNSIKLSSDSGIYFNSNTGKPTIDNIVFNNSFANNSYAIYFNLANLGATNNNISYNNIENNTRGIYWDQTNRKLLAENNWWGTSNCSAIYDHINIGGGYVDYDPPLNASFPAGLSTVCPDYCGMTLYESRNLSGSLSGCTSNGTAIALANVTLDCKGFSISGNNNNNTKGVYVFSTSTINNITIKNCYFSGFENGIFDTGSSSQYHSYINNTFRNFQVALNFTSTTTYASIINNTILGNESQYQNPRGFLIGNINVVLGHNFILNNFSHLYTAINFPQTQIDGISFSFNTLFNNTIGYFIGHSTQLNFTNERIVNSTNALLINATAGLQSPSINFFKDSLFEGNTYDLNVPSAASGNITFINSTLDKNKLKITDSFTAYFKWYVTVNVNDYSSNPLDGVNVTATNSIGTQEYVNNTNSNGIASLIVTEFYKTNGVNYYITPTNISASKNNYTTNTSNVNLLNITGSNKSIVNLILTPITCGSTIYNSFSLGNNYNCTSNGITIGADNVVIDGNNFTLTGSNSSIGIDFNGKSNIILSNLKITNFTRALNFEHTNHTKVYNLTIINNSEGIVFNNSNNNSIFNSLIENNSLTNVYAINEGGTNNSLINVSLKPENITVNGTATVYLMWYVTVNVSSLNSSGGDRRQLSGANVSAYFNNSENLDQFLLSDSNGIAQLTLAELKKNVTGVTYLTPHNISVSYSTSTETAHNYTSLNLTQTNSTNINLSISLSCTSPPSTSQTLGVNTTFCPGTFTVGGSLILPSDSILTCDNTVISAPLISSSDSKAILYVQNANNVTITGCTLNDYYVGYGVYVDHSTNVTISNMKINRSTAERTVEGFSCYQSSYISFNNSIFVDDISSDLSYCNNTVIGNNNFSLGIQYIYSGYGVQLSHSHYNFIKNNTFKTIYSGVYFNDDLDDVPPHSQNNTILGNNFSSSSNYNIYYINTSLGGDFFNTFNLSQGNTYSDYCDQGLDTNSDGYADAESTAGDWPYSENITTKIYDPNPSNKGVIDYHPRILTCPAADVFLGSTSTTSSTTTSSQSGGSALPAAPAAAPAPVAEAGQSYSVEEARKFLRTGEIQTETGNGTLLVILSLENTGTKSMLLFPQILQEVDDPFFVVTTKTLGHDNSWAEKLSGIAYSPEPVAGRLLKANILNAEQIVLQPGQKIEKVLEIKEGLAVSRQLKIQFTTFGETITEKEVQITPKKSISGAAIDVDTDKKLLDVYAIIVSEEQTKKLEQSFQPQGITGAAVFTPSPSNEYFFEININKNKQNKDTIIFPYKFTTVKNFNILFRNQSSFGDFYGPYIITQNKSLIFAQQFKFDPEKYYGQNTVETKVYRGSAVIVTNEFEVNLGVKN